MAGYPCEMKEIVSFCKSKKIQLIEDCAHAVGTKYKDKHAGNFGICGVFSFYPTKQITTGEGGIITTNSKSLFNKLIILRSHGIQRNHNKHWKYDVYHNSLNFRLTDIQCALGISQLNKINKFINKRRKISKIYDKHLS